MNQHLFYIESEDDNDARYWIAKDEKGCIIATGFDRSRVEKIAWKWLEQTTTKTYAKTNKPKNNRRKNT